MQHSCALLKQVYRSVQVLLYNMIYKNSDSIIQISNSVNHPFGSHFMWFYSYVDIPFLFWPGFYYYYFLLLETWTGGEIVHVQMNNNNKKDKYQNTLKKETKAPLFTSFSKFKILNHNLPILPRT